MISFRAPECINRVSKNSDTMALITIIMLLTVSQHIQNLGIFNTRGIIKCLSNQMFIINAWTVYLGVFRHIQNIQQYSVMVRLIEGHEDIFRHCWGILGHIEIYSEHYNPCTYNSEMFRTLEYFEPKVSSKIFQTCEIIRHIQSCGIRTVYSSIFKDI